MPADGTTCCGTCSRPSLDDVVAINASWQPDYFLDVVCPEARTEPPICPGCAVMDNPNLRAICAADRCEEIDVEADSRFSSCTTDADCVVRAPDCCECGADTSAFNLIALASSALPDYVAAVCDPEHICDDCAPTYPAEAVARCISSACRVVIGDP